ncbi:hypothetical protein NPIL_472891 [Nephila pilipes]|uniref:Uncharacterized protein n=1 Tax=Nephila pilipes TaxID=299642 RepID=A0A8X6QYS7_NEPPI|nr:hypothetical protein NPIL_472891 [Nephila pilipes]
MLTPNQLPSRVHTTVSSRPLHQHHAPPHLSSFSATRSLQAQSCSSAYLAMLCRNSILTSIQSPSRTFSSFQHLHIHYHRFCTKLLLLSISTSSIASSTTLQAAGRGLPVAFAPLPPKSACSSCITSWAAAFVAT